MGVGGNLGPAALDLLDESVDVYVLELSSFQLERLHIGDGLEQLEVGCLLNVTDDHLDRYETFDDYRAAKRRIFEMSKLAVFNRSDVSTFPHGKPGVSVGLDVPGAGEWGIASNKDQRFLNFDGNCYLNTKNLKIRGTHNEFNVLAALAIAATQHREISDYRQPLLEFRGLAHRCEWVAEVSGITFINDSKATNTGACLAALKGLGDRSRKHIVLIAGGDAKRADLAILADAFQQFVKHLVVMGKDAEDVAALVKDNESVSHANDMQDAVQRAFRAASAGDLVLLSPACASLDMYASFEERGAAFVESAKQTGAGVG